MLKRARAVLGRAGWVSCCEGPVRAGLLGKRLHGEVVPRAEACGVRGARESKGAAESVWRGAPDVRGPQVAAFPPPS